MALQLPNTSARLRTSIKLFAMVQPDYASSLVTQATGSPALGTLAGAAVLTPSINAIITGNSSQYELGEARNFSRNQTKTIYKRYSLGKDSHQAFSLVPQRIETRISVERIVLYNMDLLKRLFGFWGESLSMQQVPMLMVEYKAGPGGDLDRTAVILYNNCWFTSNPIEYDINAEDLIVVQDVDIECGEVIVLDTSAGGIASAINTTANVINTVGGSTSVVSSLLNGIGIKV